MKKRSICISGGIELFQEKASLFGGTHRPEENRKGATEVAPGGERTPREEEGGIARLLGGILFRMLI